MQISTEEAVSTVAKRYKALQDEAKAKEYYQKAYDLASESGFEDLKASIEPNLK